MYDTSSSKSTTTKSTTKSPKSSSKSKTKSKSKPKPDKIPTITFNLRAAKNWQSAKTKMSSVRALTRKKYGKTYEANATNVLLAKVDKIVNELSSDRRDFAQYQDIIELLERQGTKLNEDEEDIVRKHLRNKYEIY